ncbi:MAG TPA: hypothetical protein VNG33_21585 [Polyangiaceae bacterium]|nr:hypothetical protein [Polyangiaceae bacterium]
MLSLAVLPLVWACTTDIGDVQTTKSQPNGTAGTSSPAGGSGPVGTAGSGSPSAGTATATAGSANGTAGSAPAAGAAGQAPTGGAAGAGAGTGAGGNAGTAAGGASAGSPATGGSASTDPLPPRPINVQPGGTFSANFNGQPISVNKSKPAQGKLVLLLGGICTGTGAGGFESFIKSYGFHVFAPKTQTCVNSAPDQYKTAIKSNPLDPEANRQVGDARTELWDGVDRVDWVTVNKGESIQEETIAAINYGTAQDPGGDWGFFLNADGTLRTTDVWVVGYSWGSQTWAMISSYVRFGKVITTSGPVSEGFPDAAWITHPSATPNDRKYLLAGLDAPYPDPADAGVMAIFTNVMKAGWVGMPVNVMPNGMGTYTSDQHLFAMIGSNATSPGGHTVFCNDNPMNGWLPLCKYVVGVN